MLDLPRIDGDLSEWRTLVERMKEPKEPLSIAIVGKYVELRDSYISVKEALCHAAVYHDRDIQIDWIHSEDLDRDGDSLLRLVQGIVVPGGFGVRGIEGMVITARYARENKIPYLGLCLGMHVMTIEFARHVLNSPQANSTEFDLETPYPVIDLLTGQRRVKEKGGTMRLGTYPCHVVKGTRAASAYGEQVVYERHRHRFEFNNDFRETLERAGMVFSGLSPEGSLVEISELRDHPFMLGCQFHPEFRSRPNRPHPLFRDFVGVAKGVLREGAQPSLPL
jgi:CTP synthase